MPTPSPIIVARVGAIVGTLIRWPSRVTSDRPQARPKIAVRIGMPIATKVPNVNSSTITAMARPTISLLSVAGVDSDWPT